MHEHSNPSHYDFGNETINLMHYNSTSAPLYHIGDIRYKRLALIYSANDWFNHIETISRLKKELRGKFGQLYGLHLLLTIFCFLSLVPLLDDYLVPDHSVNHMDLVWGVEVGRLVNTKILDILDKAPRLGDETTTTTTTTKKVIS